MDDLQPLISAGKPLQPWQYAALVGTSDQVAGKRLVALVEDGYATRHKTRETGNAYLYSPAVEQDAA
jgi:hypothetical protein